VDVAYHGGAGPEPGVHHAAHRRLLPRDAVVVVVLRGLILLSPQGLLQPVVPGGENAGGGETSSHSQCQPLYVDLQNN